MGLGHVMPSSFSSAQPSGKWAQAAVKEALHLPQDSEKGRRTEKKRGMKTREECGDDREKF